MYMTSSPAHNLLKGSVTDAANIGIPKVKLQIQRATGPVVTSVKEEKQIILHTTLNIAVRRGKLRTYTLQNTLKFAPSGG